VGGGCKGKCVGYQLLELSLTLINAHVSFVVIDKPADDGRTSQAKAIREATVRDGRPRLFCTHMRLILSAIFCNVGARVLECK